VAPKEEVIDSKAKESQEDEEMKSVEEIKDTIKPEDKD
jgi:hypothetical protein